MKSAAAGNLLLVSTLSFRPGILYISEDSPNLGVTQDIGKAGHVALVATAHDGGRAFLDDSEQDVIGVVPCVPALIMRRRGQPAGGKRRAPVRLSLQIGAVAGGTLVHIDPPTLFDEFCR